MTKHIVVIDDEAMNREIMEAFLQLENYTVSLAHNGTTGLQLAKTCNPDLIILDVRMPDMNGYELCEKLRAEEITQRVPIMMVTGFDDPRDRTRAIEAGVNAFLARPFDGDVFMAQVHDLLDG